MYTNWLLVAITCMTISVKKMCVLWHQNKAGYTTLDVVTNYIYAVQKFNNNYNNTGNALLTVAICMSSVHCNCCCSSLHTQTNDHSCGCCTKLA